MYFFSSNIMGYVILSLPDVFIAKIGKQKKIAVQFEKNELTHVRYHCGLSCSNLHCLIFQ